MSQSQAHTHEANGKRPRNLWSVLHELEQCEGRIEHVNERHNDLLLQAEGYRAQLEPLGDERTALEAQAIAALDLLEPYTVATAGKQSFLLLDSRLVRCRVINAVDIAVPDNAPEFPPPARADDAQITLDEAALVIGDDGGETLADVSVAPALAQIDAEVN